MNSVELFAGAGGLSLGLERAGWKSQMLIEQDPHACGTLRYNRDNNFPLARNWNVIEDDVRTMNYEEINTKIELVAGGPPCQPFSLGGKHNGKDDERDMFPEAIRAVRDLHPKYFLFENVKGLLRGSFAEYFEYVILRLKFPFETKKTNQGWEGHKAYLKELEVSRGTFESAHMYNVNFKLVDAADYGIPQHRHRVIIVGVREDQGWFFKFPKPTHSFEALIMEKYVTKKYWNRVHANESSDRIEHKRIYHLIKKIESIPPIFQVYKPYKTVHEAIKNLPSPFVDRNKEFPNHILRLGAKPYPGHTGSALHFPSKAIKAGRHGVPGGENMIAFTDDTYRYYTTREAARIQTFPDNYVFSGSWTESMRQIGNAVPVDLGYLLGRALFEQANQQKIFDDQAERTLQSA